MTTIPQIENGHIDIANTIIEKFCQYRLSGEEWQVLWVILRKTWAWHKKEDSISISQFYQLTKMKKPSIIRALKKLIAKNIISKKANNKISLYRINKLFNSWLIVSKKANVSKSANTISKKANKSLAKKLHTKENYTKETITKEIVTKVTTNKFGRNKDIDEIISYLKEKMELPELDLSQKVNRQYAYNLLRKSKKGLLGVKWLIDIASNDGWFRHHITSLRDLWNNKVKIIANKRGEVNKVYDATNI